MCYSLAGGNRRFYGRKGHLPVWRLNMAGSMIGDNLLPDAVQTRRRRLRSRIRGLRDPIRNKRQNVVPGPDVVGRLEDSLTSVRNKAVDRDSVLDRIKERRADSGSNSSQNKQNSAESNSSNDDSSSSLV